MSCRARVVQRAGRRVPRRVLAGVAGGMAVAGLVVPLAASAAAAPANDTGSAWLQFGHDAAHSGVSTADTTLTAANVGRLTSAFTANLPGTVDGSPIALPAVTTPGGVMDLLFTTSRDGRITATNAGTGAQVWTHQNGPGTCTVNNGGTPCYSNTTPAVDPAKAFVYAYGLDGKVHRYAVGTGVETVDASWPEVTTLKPYDEKSSGALTIAATPGGTYLYAVNGGYPGDNGDYQGHVTTINLGTGTQRVFNTLCSDNTTHLGPNGCPGRQSAVWARDGVNYDPVTNRVYFATGNGPFDGVHNFGDSVLALNPDGTGTNGGPAASYTPSNQSQLNGRDADLGSTSPAFVRAPAGSTVASLAVQGGKDGQLRLLNLAALGGQVAPGRPAGELQVIPVPQGGEVLTQPAAWTNPADGSSWVFVTNGSGISALTVVVTNGVPRLVPQWNVASGGTSPIVVNNVLYYLTGNGARALDPTTGRQLWSENSNVGLHWESPIVAGGALYYPDGYSHLKAFTLPPTATTPPTSTTTTAPPTTTTTTRPPVSTTTSTTTTPPTSTTTTTRPPVTTTTAPPTSTTTTTAPPTTPRPAPTATTVTTSNNAGVGVPAVILFATITPSDATGTVAFADGATPIAGCTAQPVTAGHATCVTNFTTAGTHPVTAAYRGDPTHAASTGTTPVDVTATPTFLQIAYGYLIQFAHNLHLFGL